MSELVGLVAGSGWAAGINLYAVVALLGLAGRLGFADVPELLMRTDVLIAAGVLYLVEFVVDKIPYVDSGWDAIHTLVRPAGAAALGAVLAGDAETLGQVGSAALSGGLAFMSHSAKATTRAAINTSPEPASNVAASLFEDGLVAGVVVLAVASPLLALGAVVVLLVVGTVVTVRLWRAARRFVARHRDRRAPTSGAV